MLKIVQSNKTCYPYGMLLTGLIRNKGTTLNSEILNEIHILSEATLAELGLKIEAGETFSVNSRIFENPIPKNYVERISGDSDDDKPNACVMKRKRKDVSVVEKKKKKVKKVKTGETSVSVTSTLPELVIGLSQCFNKKKRVTRKRKERKNDQEEGRLSKGIRISEPRQEEKVVQESLVEEGWEEEQEIFVKSREESIEEKETEEERTKRLQELEER